MKYLDRSSKVFLLLLVHAHLAFHGAEAFLGGLLGPVLDIVCERCPYPPDDCPCYVLGLNGVLCEKCNGIDPKPPINRYTTNPIVTSTKQPIPPPGALTSSTSVSINLTPGISFTFKKMQCPSDCNIF
jgi:hypothetical protein